MQNNKSDILIRTIFTTVATSCINLLDREDCTATQRSRCQHDTTWIRLQQCPLVEPEYPLNVRICPPSRQTRMAMSCAQDPAPFLARCLNDSMSCAPSSAAGCPPLGKLSPSRTNLTQALKHSFVRFSQSHIALTFLPCAVQPGKGFPCLPQYTGTLAFPIPRLSTRMTRESRSFDTQRRA